MKVPVLIAALVAVWTVAPVGIAAPPGADVDRTSPDSASGTGRGLATRISVDVTEKPLAEIVDLIRNASGANIVLDRGI